ncbi:MAG: hypothetical protein GAK38_02322 [Xylophilus sp.]|nr:MAG: hypothetical protein GAK38_02322 [Xylophilus sp.]
MRLEQPVAAEGGDVLQPGCDGLGQGRHGTPRDLRRDDAGPRFPAQPREATHGLGKEALALADEAHMPVVQRPGQRHLECDAQAPGEVARCVAVVDNGVDDAQRGRACIEVQAQDEGQQGFAMLRTAFRPFLEPMRSAQHDERTLRTVALDLGALHGAAVMLRHPLRGIGVALDQQGQLGVLQGRREALSPLALQARDHQRPTARQGAAQGARIHLQCIARLRNQQGLRLRRRSDRGAQAVARAGRRVRR